MEDPGQDRQPKNTNYGACAFWGLMLLMLVIAGLVFGIVYITLIMENPKEIEPAQTCETPQCVSLAARLVNTMDTSIEPCNDFYEYACGTWIKNTIIPEGKDIVGNRYSQDDIHRDLRILLEAPAKLDEPEAIKKATSLYNSCMDKETREANGITLINRDVEMVFGGWPVLENNLGGNFNASKFDLTELLTGLFVDAGSTSLLRADAVYDSEFKLKISAGKLTGLPSEAYLVESKYREERDAYVKYMTDVAVLLGAHPDVAGPEMAAVLYLEQQLAQAKLDSEETPKEFNVTEMQRRYPEIDWLQFLKRLIPESVADVTDGFVVVNHNSVYLRKALDILNDVPERLRADWMLWLCYEEATLYLNDAIRNAYYEFVTSIYGTPPKEYYEDCVLLGVRAMHSVSARLFFDQHLPMPGTKESIKVIFESVKTAQLKLLEDSNIEENTKQWAASWLKDATIEFNFPDYIFDNDLLDQEYENLTWPQTGDNVFSNFLAASSFQVQQNIALLSEDGFENKYLHRPESMDLLTIVVLSTTVQPPVYDKDWPWFLNFGSFGTFIGDRFTDELDPLATFAAETVQCVQYQYGGFFFPENDKPFVANTTDILSDNAGLQIATQAFSDEISSRELQTLPGLELTAQQLFFLNNAQTWCDKYTKEYADTFGTTPGQTTPGRFRVNGMMQNSAAFAEAFNCTIDSKMNPENKCTVY